MSESRVDNAELTRSVVDHIEAHAARWLGSGEPASVVVAGVDDRPQSVQLRLGVRAGGAARELIVKSPKAVTGVARSGRLVTPVSDPLEKSRLELAALTVMADHFSALADPRFGWVEVFDGLDDPPAIVVGRVGGTTFDEVLRRPRRFAAVASPASVAANLGAWLVEYHSLSTPRAVVRDSSAEEVIAGIAMLA
ncbi:MAG: hypothetical protein ACE5GB_04455, partial [Acidimicrobiales bacterium]